jgi:UDP-N-acetylglucosamine 1-carboxyvinyltransferase
MHIQGLEALGAEFRFDGGVLDATADSGLVGCEHTLAFPSVGATENIVLAAVLAKGTTVLDNAAREPEVTDLLEFLSRMGARIDGIGTSTLAIHGVVGDDLVPADHRVVPDRVEAATYLAATGLAGGQIVVQGARAEQMSMLIRKLTEMGMTIEDTPNGLVAGASGRLRSADVATLPYPGVATDYKPMLSALLSVADGVGIVTENLFSGRFRYVEELVRMGADIRTDSHHAVVRGVTRLHGAEVCAHDIRAGAALVVAGLAADSETIVAGAGHIDRGYEDLVGKLRSLGADLVRV